MSNRRQAVNGDPMLVKLPEAYGKNWEQQKGFEWYNTGEGGLAFFFMVRQRPFDKRRQVCIAGDIFFPEQDVVVTEGWQKMRAVDRAIDAGLLIGSTGLSLARTDDTAAYFEPTFDDLTTVGQMLYRTLESLYGKGSVSIVTLLDT